MRKPYCDKEDMRKGAWSKQEDQKLIDYIKKHGEGHWHDIPKAAGLLRCSKSCRLRWTNYLRPNLKRGNFSEDEEDLIIKLHALLGNRWSLIAGRLPGRTGNEVKNYWNSHLTKKLTRMGIDPKHHRLSHYLSRLRLNGFSEQGTTSSSACRILQPSHQTIKSGGSGSDDVQVSDAGSCIHDESSNLLPDLNVDLATNSTLPSDAAIEEKTNYNELLTSREPECYLSPTAPTLQLFR